MDWRLQPVERLQLPAKASSPANFPAKKASSPANFPAKKASSPANLPAKEDYV
jgi:hypothetical protein